MPKYVFICCKITTETTYRNESCRFQMHTFFNVFPIFSVTWNFTNSWRISTSFPQWRKKRNVSPMRTTCWNSWSPDTRSESPSKRGWMRCPYTPQRKSSGMKILFLWSTSLEKVNVKKENKTRHGILNCKRLFNKMSNWWHFLYFKYIFRLLIKTGNVTAFTISHLQKSMNPNKYLYSYELLIHFQSQEEFFLEKKMQESSVVCISDL